MYPDGRLHRRGIALEVYISHFWRELVRFGYKGVIGFENSQQVSAWIGVDCRLEDMVHWTLVMGGFEVAENHLGGGGRGLVREGRIGAQCLLRGSWWGLSGSSVVGPGGCNLNLCLRVYTLIGPNVLTIIIRRIRHKSSCAFAFYLRSNVSQDYTKAVPPYPFTLF